MSPPTRHNGETRHTPTADNGQVWDWICRTIEQQQTDQREMLVALTELQNESKHICQALISGTKRMDAHDGHLDELRGQLGELKVQMVIPSTVAGWGIMGVLGVIGLLGVQLYRLATGG